MVFSESRDLACRFIGLPDSSDAVAFPTKLLLQQKYVRPGAPVLVLGFPLGLRSKQYSIPIVRKGIVALSEPGNIIVDAAIFPGNSGGPVIYVPTIKLGRGLKTTTLNKERVVGLVSSVISYVESAISPKSGRPRITFEDNAGLAKIIPSDAVLELLNRDDVVKFEKKLPSANPSPNQQ